MASRDNEPSLTLSLSLSLAMTRCSVLVPLFSGAYFYFSYSLVSPTNGFCSRDRTKAVLNVETLLCLIMASRHLSLSRTHSHTHAHTHTHALIHSRSRTFACTHALSLLSVLMATRRHSVFLGARQPKWVYHGVAQHPPHSNSNCYNLSSGHLSLPENLPALG